MTLHNKVQELIKSDRETLTQEYENKLETVRSEYEAKVSSLKRAYRSQIGDEIKSKIYLETYSSKKQDAFQTGEEINHKINDLYLSLVPDIIASSTFHNNLVEFLSPIDKGTRLVISGQYKDVLNKIVINLGYKNVQEEKETGLGKIVYSGDQVEGEFSIEDIIQTIKSQTINKITTLLR